MISNSKLGHYLFLKSALNALVLVLAYRVLRTQMKLWAQARAKKEGERLAMKKQDEWIKNCGGPSNLPVQ